jgi:predicted transcriptional regulator of viral defense system
MANLATEQYRVVSAAQLHALGVHRGGIQRRVSRGRLHRVHRGVYAVGTPNLSRNGFLIAAVYACGEGALLSHKTAAQHWGLTQSATAAIHVTVPSRNKPDVKGVTVHLTRELTAADRAIHEGIPSTSVARTLVDYAATATQTQLIEAIEQAERLRIFDLKAVHDALDRSNGRKGAKALRAALSELFHEPPDTRSKLEQRFRFFCKSRGLAVPSFNVSVGGFCVDGAWAGTNLVLELDSKRHHLGLTAFEADRKRDTKLQIAGHRIVRVTDKRMKHEPDELEQDLRSLLQ